MVDFDRYEAIEVTRDGTVLTATFDRPEHLNAINASVHRELEGLFVDIERDDDVKLAVLTGKGRAFSAGGDLDWLLELNADPAASARAIVGDRRIQNALLSMETPIIAKVNGPAVGLGCSIALFCDIVIATPDAIFSDPHVSVGLVAGDGGRVALAPAHRVSRARVVTSSPGMRSRAPRRRRWV